MHIVLCALVLEWTVTHSWTVFEDSVRVTVANKPKLSLS